MSARILIVDDHAMFREGVRSLLEKSGFDVVGEAGDGREAIEKARELEPDVVVMDITLPQLDGVMATRGILTNAPNTKVLALSIHGGKRFVENMLRSGAAGYILKDSVPEELVEGVQAVLQEKTYLSPEVTGLVVSQYVDLLSRVQATGGPAKLTRDELQYIQLVGEGYRDEEIAERLQADDADLHSVTRSVLTKLQLSTVQELTDYAGAQKWFGGKDGMEAALNQDLAAGSKRARPPRPQPLIEPLTNRELDVLNLLAKRLYDKEIADQLSVSVTTVKTHISHILQKLGVGNRREAADKAKDLGIVD